MKTLELTINLLKRHENAEVQKQASELDLRLIGIKLRNKQGLNSNTSEEKLADDLEELISRFDVKYEEIV